MSRFLRFSLGSCLIALAGCSEGAGADRPEAQPPADSGVPANASCPAGFDSFEPGDSELGGLNVLEAELLGAEPAIAAKFRNVWNLSLRFPDGAPAEDFRVTSAATFMPVHGHPGQPEPSVAWEGEGRLRMVLHFTMRGPWEVRLAVASESAGMDQFAFDVCVRE